MKILHVCPLYYPAVGGVENVFRAVSEGLVRRGEDVTVFTTTGRSLRSFLNTGEKPLPAGDDVINGVRVRRFPYRRLPRLAARAFVQGWSAMQLPGSGSLKAWSALPWVPRLAEEIAAFKPDVVLAGHFLTGIVIAACRAKDKAGFPLTLFSALHLDAGSDIPEEALKYLRMGDAVWTTTSHEREYLLGRGIDSGRLPEIGAGVWPDEFRGGDGKGIRERFGLGHAPVVLFVGRREKDKGVETLARSMERVWKRFPEARLMLAGPSVRSSDGRALDEWIKRFRGSVVSLDSFNDDEKKDIYDACDVFVLPSRIESFGIVYLEAWVCGKPVIGADIGSTRSIIREGKDGLLARFDDAEMLADKICCLIEHPDLRRSMGEEGRKKVIEGYTWDAVVDRLLEVYRGFGTK